MHANTLRQCVERESMGSIGNAFVTIVNINFRAGSPKRPEKITCPSALGDALSFTDATYSTASIVSKRHEYRYTGLPRVREKLSVQRSHCYILMPASGNSFRETLPQWQSATTARMRAFNDRGSLSRFPAISIYTRVIHCRR